MTGRRPPILEPLFQAFITRSTVGPAPSAKELINIRRIWYGGAICLFHAVMENMGPDGEPTEAEMSFMDDLNGELRAFERAARTGKDGGTTLADAERARAERWPR